LNDSIEIKKKLKVFPKPGSADQSQPAISEHANYYAARSEIGCCKYMSQKTIAFWAMNKIPKKTSLKKASAPHKSSTYVAYSGIAKPTYPKIANSF